jgi:protein ImuB
MLRNFSPEVEPSASEFGVFWLNAAGLGRLHKSPKKWAATIRADIKYGAGLDSTVVVGFTRFGTSALAHSQSGIVILASPKDEADAIGQVELKCLGLLPVDIQGLSRLGVYTVGDLLRLPTDGLLERFGSRVQKLRILASRECWDPLQPTVPVEQSCERLDFDYPEENAMRLTFFCKRLLAPLLEKAVASHQAVVGLEIGLVFHRNENRVELVEPAAPTLDGAQLIDLVRLRLEAIELETGATELSITARTVPASTDQLRLFAAVPCRDIGEANRTLARLRAEFGSHSVVRAIIKEGHLPEARFAFEPLDRIEPPRARKSKEEKECQGNENKNPRTLVRRIYAKPLPLQSRPVVGPRGCHFEGMGEAPATRFNGPYIISGGWWAKEVHREYHFAQTEAGRILWVYFDKKRRSWFIHGEVE